MRIGDSAFRGNGIPGVVDHKDQHGNIKVATDDAKVREQFRHGYLNGMEPEERTAFNSLLDQVRQLEDPKEKVRLLQERVDELNQEPAKNRNLIRYLSSELWHVMQTHNVQPTVYNIAARDARF